MCSGSQISQDSDPEHLTKVATKSRKHSIYSLPKRPKLRRLLENQFSKRLLAEDALAKLYFVQKSLVTG